MIKSYILVENRRKTGNLCEIIKRLALENKIMIAGRMIGTGKLIKEMGKLKLNLLN